MSNLTMFHFKDWFLHRKAAALFEVNLKKLVPEHIQNITGHFAHWNHVLDSDTVRWIELRNVSVKDSGVPVAESSELL